MSCRQGLALLLLVMHQQILCSGLLGVSLIGDVIHDLLGKLTLGGPSPSSELLRASPSQARQEKPGGSHRRQSPKPTCHVDTDANANGEPKILTCAMEPYTNACD